MLNDRNLLNTEWIRTINSDVVHMPCSDSLLKTAPHAGDNLPYITEIRATTCTTPFFLSTNKLDIIGINCNGICSSLN